MSAIHVSLSTVESALGKVATELSNEIQKSAVAQKYEEIDRLNQGAKRIAAMLAEMRAEHQRLGCCVGSSKKQFSVTVTQGALENQYFAITPALKSGLLKPHQAIQVKLPTGVVFQTVAMPPNRLRERGKIGDFYTAAKVKAGDTFAVTEISPNVWEIAKA